LFHETFVPQNICSTRLLIHKTFVPRDFCSKKYLFNRTFVPKNICSIGHFFQKTFVPRNFCSNLGTKVPWNKCFVEQLLRALIILWFKMDLNRDNYYLKSVVVYIMIIDKDVLIFNQSARVECFVSFVSRLCFTVIQCNIFFHYLTFILYIIFRH